MAASDRPEIPSQRADGVHVVVFVDSILLFFIALDVDESPDPRFLALLLLNLRFSEGSPSEEEIDEDFDFSKRWLYLRKPLAQNVIANFTTYLYLE